MSFGWSAGDIASAIKLVNKIIQSVSNAGGAREHFQELESELRGLLRALHEISNLTSQPGQIPEILALKFAACLCEDTLKTFFEKIKPFDESLRKDSLISKFKATPRMVRWELLVKKDIPEFRSYLVAHVGSLNLRLNTALLQMTSKLLTNQVQNHDIQNRATEERWDQLGIQAHHICARINAIAREDTIPKLDSLLDVASGVWRAQSEMIQMFAKVLESLPPPNLRYTWVQAPVKFEDALGRVIPVPSEYDWDKLEAIIQAQFKTGPGQTKVRSGEYELFTGMPSLVPLKAQNFHLFPGMNITMTFIIGQYIGSERCPSMGCTSRSFTKAFTVEREGRICLECCVWFRKSESVLAKPMKPPMVGEAQETSTRQTNNIRHWTNSNASAALRDRMNYKNISIYITELPPTPKQFRDKYHRTKEPSQPNRRVMPFVKRTANSQSEGPPLSMMRKADYTWSHRPQTYQMAYIPKSPVASRPYTLDFNIAITEARDVKMPRLGRERSAKRTTSNRLFLVTSVAPRNPSATRGRFQVEIRCLPKGFTQKSISQTKSDKAGPGKPSATKASAVKSKPTTLPIPTSVASKNVAGKTGSETKSDDGDDDGCRFCDRDGEFDFSNCKKENSDELCCGCADTVHHNTCHTCSELFMGLDEYKISHGECRDCFMRDADAELNRESDELDPDSEGLEEGLLQLYGESDSW
ncbi:hypothetical protein G7Y89_g13272 [Cudoniella acicularis]|uniref:Ubiquitin-like domain-containing protein n=1 Tax=Cudoniella acicularis TaxID=354080 RepID=A0A8H4VYV4_9HELO|nr:hypothetical protein G7Y89_g13272 [Cudoniella acicularis]